MINFLKNWIEGIALSVILVSIFEMILPDGNLKKYIKIVLGIYIVFSIISPFVDSNAIYSFNVVDEIEEYSNLNDYSVQAKNNIEDMYIDTLESKIKLTIEKYGYNVRSCLVRGTFEGNEEDIGIKKIIIVVSSKNSNYYKEKDEIGKIEKVEIKVDTNNQKNNENNEITNDDIKNLKEYLSNYYELDKKIIDIQSY